MPEVKLNKQGENKGETTPQTKAVNIDTDALEWFKHATENMSD